MLATQKWHGSTVRCSMDNDDGSKILAGLCVVTDFTMVLAALGIVSHF